MASGDARYQRFSFLYNRLEREQLKQLAKKLRRSLADAVREAIRESYLKHCGASELQRDTEHTLKDRIAGLIEGRGESILCDEGIDSDVCSELADSIMEEVKRA